ncbi:MAG: adenylate/guanylate cyclase domain-containing protein [Bacteroidota bacterium]
MKVHSLLHGIQKSKTLKFLVLGFFGALFTLLVQILGFVDGSELKTLDRRFLQATHPEEADTNIVMIAIDQNSLEAFADRNVQWPWPREFYGIVVDYLRSAGASSVSFDMMFDRNDFDRRETDGTVSDSAFAEAMNKSGNVALVTFLSMHEKGDKYGGVILDRHLTSGNFPFIAIPQYNRANAPIPLFQQATKILAVANFESDKDGISRRVPLVYRFKHGYIPNLGLAVYLLDKKIPLDKMGDAVNKIPISNDGHFLIYWYGKGGTEGVFKYYPFAAIFSSALDMKSGKSPVLSPSVFKSKKVIIGGTAPGLLDFKPTPFTSLEVYPGMEIYATIMSNLFNGHFLHESPKWLTYFLIIMLSFLSAFIFFHIRKLTTAIATFISIILLYVGFTFFLFYQEKFWLPIITPSIALISTFAFSAFFSYATEDRQRRELRRAFNRYLSPTIVSQIVDNSGALELGGHTIEGTVFFSDIKNFTCTAESMQPKELVLYLNEYFSIISDLILKQEAMLDKYIGDAVMAIFGAPIPKSNHAKLACLTALEIQQALSMHYNNKSAQTPHFITRIGLNSGKMVVGNIGSSKRLDYTAIGDTVNLASRIEGANKFFGTKILITETVYEQAKDVIETRELDFICVKGKNSPVRIYELLGEKDSLDEKSKEFFSLFHEGLQMYRMQQWDSAIRQFESLLNVSPEDGPCKTYLERCQMLALRKLPPDWDGVYTLSSK